MFDKTPDGILYLVATGESKVVEFKSRLPQADIIARVIASFANADGGILLIGIQDNGEITGVPVDELESSITRLKKVGSSLLPYPLETGVVDIEGKKVIYTQVGKAPEHLFPIMSSRGEVFQRVGERNVVIPSSSLRDVIRETVEAIEQPKKKIIAFVAMSFREEEEPALVDYYKAMERAVKATELPIELRRMDLVEGDYEISQQIMDEIDQSDIVIADFTLSSRNVYFELGYARGKEQRVIQTARRGTDLEFDVRNWRTIFYRNATELEEKLISEIMSAYADVATKK
ncbi:MAG: ATP-binding protein [Chloroflexi bacterium]|nr:ATP-binding protein [Chloroflexota bacterium]